MSEVRTRTRLSPAARKDQLLDHARSMVTGSGLQAFTMEGLARHAGVSAPLVYNYFPNRADLLQALLKREYQRFVDEFSVSAQDAKNFEDIVRISVASNFDHHAPGNILPLLLSQPEIAEVIANEQKKLSRQNARFLVKAAATQYKLDNNDAQLVVSMSSGASIAAAGLAAGMGLNREETIERAVAYIMAGIKRLAKQ